MDSAPNIIFSYPEFDGVTEYRMTPLLIPLQDHVVSANIEISHRLKDAFEPCLEIFSDPTHIQLMESEKTLFTNQPVKGGTQLIQNQSHCPFKAFALHRLSADTLELPKYDFDFSERGTLVHKALEVFWQKTRSQKELLRLFFTDEIDQQIAQCVAEALLPFTEKLKGQSKFLEMESKRTHKLLKDWLANKEKFRPDFTVLDEEKAETVQVGNLSISLRLDRIDKTSDGKLFLIDYKTGSSTPNSWFGERPEQPQIPLYALQLQPGAMAFAQIKPGDMKFKGVYDPDSDGYGLKENNFSKITDCQTWDHLLAYWQNNLTRLADNFISGHMEVDPIKAGDTCRYCNLDTFCRIREKTNVVTNEEDIP